jgi:hypothetical protein
MLLAIFAVGADDGSHSLLLLLFLQLFNNSITFLLLILLARSSRLLSCKLSSCKLLVNYLDVNVL